MKKLIALIVAAVSVCTVFAFSACGNSSGVSDSKLEKIKESETDKMTASSWSKAFSSSDIYNSTAVLKYTSESSVYDGTISRESSTSTKTTLYNDVTLKKGVITGTEHAITETEYYYEYNEEVSYYYTAGEMYYIFDDDDTLTTYEAYGDAYAIEVEVDEDGFSEGSTMMGEMYIHYSSDALDFDDFERDSRSGSYIYEETSGYYTYSYELKFSDGNLVYCCMETTYKNKSTSYSSSSTETYEYYYIYDEPEVSVSKSVQKKIDAIAENY